jgi:hypothetical protein
MSNSESNDDINNVGDPLADITKEMLYGKHNEESKWEEHEHVGNKDFLPAPDLLSLSFKIRF